MQRRIAVPLSVIRSPLSVICGGRRPRLQDNGAREGDRCGRRFRLSRLWKFR